MTSLEIKPPHEHTRREATAWLIAFSEGEVKAIECARFETWLKASPENVRAYLEVSSFWEAASVLKPAEEDYMDDLLRLAAAESNIIALEGMGSTSPRAHEVPRRLRTPFVIAATFFMIMAAGLLLWWQRARPPIYTTMVGEQRRIELADGSTIELNARSRVVVRFTELQRRIDLLEGQALFHVAREAARAFIVHTGAVQMRAVGTEFDVDRKASGTVVTVVEGRVAISGSDIAPAASLPPSTSTDSNAYTVLLNAGDQVTVKAKAITPALHTDPAAATSWTQGKLVFDSVTLEDLIQVFNRYHSKPLAVDDPKLLALHVSGTFSTGDPEQIVRFLAQRFGLSIHETSDSIQLSHQ